MSRPNPGRPALHRLNRAEYANAIRDLLGLDVDVSLLLPPDDAAYGFDNVADVLGNSPALLQSYLTAARSIGAMAVGDPTAPPDGTPPIRRGRICRRIAISTVCRSARSAACRRAHIFPVDGEYEFQIRLYRTNLSAIRGLEDPHQVELHDRRAAHPARPASAATRICPRCRTNPTDASDILEAERLKSRVPSRRAA